MNNNDNNIFEQMNQEQQPMYQNQQMGYQGQQPMYQNQQMGYQGQQAMY